ncbi:MAG: phosphoribosyltransferase [Cyclobacteriaceae bacterium]|nr:phosphoribosyltransferase [Cyclobacteriaceae bacterium]
MTSTENMILNKQQIQQKISRIAYEIYENNYREKKLYVAGIPSGYKLAKLLVKELKKISPFDITLLKVEFLHKKPSEESISVDCDPKELQGSVLILVDDVLHTGKTFLHSLRPFMDVDIKKIETAVLVDRSHKLFPISSDYVGYELSTTLNDHIEVVLNPGKYGVYLY